MNQIVQNDPCSCGSGKEYKDCCIDIPWPIYPEEYVLADLLKSSKEFIAFYHAERIKKITVPIYWALDPSHSYDAMITKILDKQIIRLKNIPAKPEESLTVAHEIEHIIQDIDGYPSTGTSHSTEDLFKEISATLNSMVQDPLIVPILLQYGFDEVAHYKKEVEDSIKELSLLKIPDDKYRKTGFIFNYVSKILDRETLCNLGYEIDNDFFVCFKSRYPEIIEECEYLLAVIKYIGFDTPPKMFKLFEKIINRYNLKALNIFPVYC